MDCSVHLCALQVLYASASQGMAQPQQQQQQQQQQNGGGGLLQSYGPVHNLRRALENRGQVSNLLHACSMRGLHHSYSPRVLHARAAEALLNCTHATQGGNKQQQDVQQQLGVARSILRDVVRADLVELHRLGEQVEELRAWLTNAQPAMGHPA